MSLHKKLMKLPKEPTIAGLRPMEKRDTKAVWQLLTEYLKRMDSSFLYNKEEVAHQMLPRENVMFSHVVENDEGEITDFISYYSLPSTVLKSSDYDKINACFAYYNVATSVDMTELMRNAVILAQIDGFDVYNCLNIMDNQEVFEELKFGRGSGSLQYYFFNYAFGNTKADKVGLVLV